MAEEEQGSWRNNQNGKDSLLRKVGGSKELGSFEDVKRASEL